MNALSILQPWASLIVHGCKRIETRSWQTLYRGPLAIHAGSRFRRLERDLCMTHPFHAALAATGIKRPGELALGCIVGVVNLLDCVPTCEVADALDPRERPFGDYGAGRYAWLLGDPVALAVPLPCAGRLGVFPVSEAIAALLHAHQAAG